MPAVLASEPPLDWDVPPAELALPPLSAELPSLLLWQADTANIPTNARPPIFLVMTRPFTHNALIDEHRSTVKCRAACRERGNKSSIRLTLSAVIESFRCRATFPPIPCQWFMVTRHVAGGAAFGVAPRPAAGATGPRFWA